MYWESNQNGGGCITDRGIFQKKGVVIIAAEDKADRQTPTDGMILQMLLV